LIAVRNAAGKLVMEGVIETKASMILEFVDGLRADVQVTFEEGTWAAWLYDVLKPHVTRLVVCDPRRNALLQDGNQNDRVDARKLAELLQNNQLRSVYHGDHGLRTLKELVRSYLTITKDLSRVMSRVKAIYRSWAIPCTGKQVYGLRHRAEWLGKISEPGVHRRCRVLLPAAGCAESVASGSAERSARGEQEAEGLETALPDSLDRSDPGGGVAGHPADPAPLPHQATAVDLQRFRRRGAQQRRSPGCEGQLQRKKKRSRFAG
jgi:transposase